MRQMIFIAFVLSTNCMLCEAKKKKTYDDPQVNAFMHYDYCQLNCVLPDGKKEPHTACKAYPKKPRIEVLYPPQQEFRQTMVDEHNKYRDYIASGKEQRPEPGWAGTASNMMVMNYDLELEYIARCRAVHSFQRTPDMATGHDKCKPRMGNKPVGQNLHGTSANKSESQKKSVKNWYDEVALVKKADHFLHKPSSAEAGAKIGHFTELVWWSLDLVGCWRTYNPINPRPFQFAVICNYASSFDSSAGNVVGQPLYKREKPCSECPNGTKCQTPAFPSLCGPLIPITKVQIPQCGGSSRFTCSIFIIVAAVLHFLY